MTSIDKTELWQRIIDILESSDLTDAKITESLQAKGWHQDGLGEAVRDVLNDPWQKLAERQGDVWRLTEYARQPAESEPRLHK